MAAVGGEVKRIDILIVARELVADGFGRNVPNLGRSSQHKRRQACDRGWTYPNDLVFSTGGEISAIRAEANATNIQIAILAGVTILQVADLLSGINVKDLSTTIATRGNIAAIMAEADAAHDTLMSKIVHKVYIKPTSFAGIENGVPVFSLTLEMRWKLLWIEVGQLVPDALKICFTILKVWGKLGTRSWRWSWAGERRMRRTCIRVGLSLIWSGGSIEPTCANTRFTWAWRGRFLRCLRPVAWKRS